MRLTGKYLLQIISVGVFFGIGFVVCPICWLLAKLSRGRLPSWTGQAVIHGLFLFYRWWLQTLRLFRVHVENPESFQSLHGVIIAPNHPSIIDAVFILALVPRAVCVMRASLFRNPMLGGAALLAGYVTNDSGPALIRQAMEKVQRGENLLIFPEGTRTETGAVNSFKQGFAYIAVRTNTPVQTVFIERCGLYLSKNVSLFSPAQFPIKITIRPGALIAPIAGESAKEFSVRLENYFRMHLENTGNDIRLKKAVIY